MSAYATREQIPSAVIQSRRCRLCREAFVPKYAASQQAFCGRDCVREARRRGMTTVAPWTDAEIGALEEMWHLSARAAGDRLGRGMQSVQHMRNKLRSGWVPEKEPWSESEIEFVRRTPNLTAAQVAGHLGRTTLAVSGQRMLLRRSEGLNFAGGDKHGHGAASKSPGDVAGRRLLAKTCLGCGLLLESSWFARKKARTWASRCNRCSGQTYKPKRSTYDKDAGKSARKSAALMDSLTRPHATNHGQPWLDKDHVVLRDGELTILEKALKLGRTWAATGHAVRVNGYTSRVGRGDPVHGQWVIDNPNAVAA